MKESRNGSGPSRAPVKQLPSAGEMRAQRFQRNLQRSSERKQQLLMARRTSAPATPNVVALHSPFAMPQHSMAPHSPFSMPQHSSMMPPIPFAPPQHNMARPMPFALPQQHSMTSYSPFAMPQHSMMSPTPFSLPPPHLTLLQSPRAPSAMDVDGPTPRGASPGAPLSPLLLPQTHALPQAPQPTTPLTPEQTLGMSQQNWAKFSERSATERRRDVMGLPAPVHRPSPDLSNFLYDKGGVKLEHQVKYGPGAGIGSSDQSGIDTHYGAKTKPRLTQYSSNREHYVSAANQTGRPLTHQEFDVSQRKDPGPTSINHVIASGTGQNLMNQMTLQFNQGVARVGTAKFGKDQKGMLTGIAQQAAAVGRMTGIGRAIQTEEAPQGRLARPVSDNPGGAGREPRDAHLFKRDTMTKNVLSAFQANTEQARYGAYKGYLKSTFDSFGNLRLGHGTGNGRVSTGLDIPLTSKMMPTARGERLYQANLTFGLPAMEVPQNSQAGGAKFRSGIFTTTTVGQKLTSSTEK
ncbi:hypothetical protein PQR46_36645 [Paraburkholderia sediminicola]|uniref:hypothetical protein n=1 Tax=Paraburkholderia TaxID=1822464 RepID=UPI0038BD5C60